MPIRVENDLPARAVLESENIFMMGMNRAEMQEIRPLEILILNLMPVKPDYETQLLRAANDGLVSLIVRTRAASSAPVIMRSSLSSKQLFEEYYRCVYGEDPASDLTQAFLELLEEEA